MTSLRQKIRTSAGYRWFLLAIVMLGTFMAVLDATIINVGMPTMMESFGVDVASAEWIVTAYMITMTLMLPTAGWLADKYGNKRVYLLGLAVFTIGSFLCGQADSEPFLVAARAVQGVGGGTIQALGLAIISREFTPRQRPVALGIWSVASAASVSFGPLLGGWIIDHFEWTVMFSINVPVGILGLLAGILIQKEWKAAKMGTFDRVGFGAAALFLPVILFAMTRGQAGGWTSPPVLGAFAVAAAALFVFIRTELRHPDPLLNIRLLKDRHFGTAMTVLLIFGIGLFGGTYLLPLYTQQGLGYTALAAGSLFLPVGIIQGAASTLTGWLARRTGTLTLAAAGILLLAASFWIMGGFDARTTRGTILAVLCLRGLGMGLTFAPLQVFALTNLKNSEMANASGISNGLRQLSGSFSIALLTAILAARTAVHAAAGAAETEALIDGVTDDLRITAVLMLCSLVPIGWYFLGKSRHLPIR